MINSNRFLKFPFVFDKALLEKDLKKCLTVTWPTHFNQKDYAGSWTSISLRSASGSGHDIYAHHGSYSDTPFLSGCAYFSEIIDRFECEKESIRLMCLAPGSVIREHRDPGAGYGAGFFRLHIPIRTGTGVSFIVDGVSLPMKTGECWYADFQLPHSVYNESRTERIHLVIDCLRNAWSDQMFLAAGYDFDKERRAKEPDLQTKEKIISELSRLDTDTARALIAQLSGENKEQLL